MAIAPLNGNTDSLLSSCQSGQVIDYADPTSMKEFLIEQHLQWTQGRLNQGTRPFPAYHRKTLTRRLAQVFDSLVESKA
jgi:hypothetical protein